jgi:predicted nucleic acid-binding protein
MFLIDTDVLSDLRKRNRNRGVVAWMEATRSVDLFISVITIGEIERGIGRQEAKDPVFAAALAGWLDRLLAVYGDRIIGIDLAVARCWGRLSATVAHGGADLMIAATALERGLTVVTRNTRHFAPSKVATLNPFV